MSEHERDGRSIAGTGRPLTFRPDFLRASRTSLYTDATLASIFRELKKEGSGPIVDVGSGTGFFLESCVQNLNVGPALKIRLDPDDALLRTGIDAHRVLASGTAMPFASSSVGIALCHFVLTRVQRATAVTILEEVSRVLRRDGLLLIIEPCLGLSTYHSANDPNVGRLMAIARRMKAEYQLEVNGVDEDFGLDLPDQVSRVLEIQVVDLHVARWFTSFPQEPDEAWFEAMRHRAEELKDRDAATDFLNAHGVGKLPFLVPGPDLVNERNRTIALTRAGFEAMNEARVRDLLGAADASCEEGRSRAPVDFIPVVRVVAKKRT